MSRAEGPGSLKVQLLGPPHIERDGAPAAPTTRKAVALLAYLAVTGRAHGRDTLATLFWPEFSQERAYANLRRTLWALNAALGKGWLDADNESVGLARGAPGLEVDVVAFREYLAACRAHPHPPGEVCPDCLSPLACAAELYHGDFMAGLTLTDSPAFDDWQFFESESLRRDLAWALEKLVRAHVARGELGPAIAHARRRLALDPLHEPAHRGLMALYAWDGQRSAALRQYDECRAVLDTELGLAPDAETVQLMESIRANRLPPPPAWGAPSPPPAAPGPRHNLPPQPTSFVAREAELDEIARLLRDPACRLLTLAGTGGAGKTRLAVESARRLLDEGPDAAPVRDGAYLVPLAPLADVRQLVPAIAGAVGFAFSQQEGDEPQRQLFGYLRDRQMLLILDNFETLVDGAGLVAGLLEHAPGVKVLATSRERLNVRWEWALAVGGLEYPPGAGPAPDAARYGAVRLFVQRARQANAGLALSEADLADVVRICRLVEGLPLGIELAATWARLMSCRDIAAEIARSLDFLSTSLRDVPERHRSLRAVFDHSWRLLSDGERRALARLSVFADQFDRPAAEYVAGAHIGLLSSLVDKSLVAHLPSGRYGIHDMVCQFAAARLDADPGERAAAMDRHAAYYTAFLERLEHDVMGGRQVAALDEIGREIENCRAAWRRAAERRQWDELRAAAASLFTFYDIRSRFREGEEAFALAAGALEPAAGEAERAAGLLLAYQAACAVRLQRFEPARAAAQRSLALLEPWPLSEELAWARIVAAGAGLLSAGPGTRAVLLDAVEVMRRANRAHLIVFCYAALGDLSGTPHDRQQAKRLLQERLALSQDQGERSAQAVVEFELGQHAESRAAMAEALRHYGRSLDIRRELGDRAGISTCLDHMGYVAREMGQFDESRRLHLESLDISRELGDPLGISGSLGNLGLLAWNEGDYDRATRLFEESLAIRRRVGRAWEIGLTAFLLGYAALRQAAYERAAARFVESIDLLHRLPGRPGLEMALNGLGESCLGLGDAPSARRHLRAALRVVARGRNLIGAMWILDGVAALLIHTGRLERAAEVLVAVRHQPSFNPARHAEQLLAALAPRLPPDLVPRLEAQAAGVDIGQFMVRLVAEI